jgi:hypothetical protein
MFTRKLVSGALAALLVSAGLVAAQEPAGAIPALSTIVDVDGFGSAADCNSLVPASTSVQTAVDNAAAGGTVTICPGTYNEQVSIAKDLTVHGTNEATVIIRAPESMASSAAVAGNTAIIEVSDGATVAADGFTVSGPGPGTCESLHYGLLIGGDATVSAEHVTVTAIRDAPFTNCQNGWSILAGASSDQPGHFTGSHMTITDYQKSGLTSIGASSDASLTDSTVTGVGVTPVIAQNGIVISNGADATITGNAISGNECDHESCGPDFDFQTQSMGVLMLSPGTVTVSGNDITGNDLGVFNEVNSGPVAVSGNTISSRYENVFLGQGTTTVSDNVITGANIGIWAETADFYEANTVAHVDGNTITGAAQAGILVSDLTPSDLLTVALDATLNRIAGNDIGVDNQTTSEVSAVENWWGCNGGPTDLPCDPTSGTVTAQPRLVAKVARSAAATTSTAVITVDLRRNSNGALTAGVPDGTPVGFTTSRGVLEPWSTTTTNGIAMTTLRTNGQFGVAAVTAGVDSQALSTTVTLQRPKLTLTAVPSHVEGNTGETLHTFAAHLSSASDVAVTAHYATSDLTATTADGDYDAAAGTVTFEPGDVDESFAVAVYGDTRDEPNQNFRAALSAPVNATGSPYKVVVIADDDDPPTVSISDAETVEGAYAVFTVTLSAVSGQTVKVHYQTQNGTALAPQDYTAKSGNLVFLPGQTSKTFSVLVRFDSTVEEIQVFHANLSAPLLSVIGDGTGDAAIAANNS